MADAIVSLIVDQLVDKAKEEVRLLAAVKGEVKKLERNLTAIRAVLTDAEEKKTKNRVIKHWLDSLRQACFDMEDTLDEWRTLVELEVLHGEDASSARRRLEKVLTLLSISCFSFRRLGTHRAIALKMKEINQRFDEIAKEKDLISQEIDQLHQGPDSPVFIGSNIYGRGIVKDKIMMLLLSTEGEQIETISIVGMGGLGKTALARLVYDDHHFQGVFDSRIWVSFSPHFDLKRVAKTIIQRLGILKYDIGSYSSQVLLEMISSSICGKKLLLVLDDVWADQGNQWESLLLSFRSCAPDSKILVTTRDFNVAKMMGSEFSQIISLEKLGEEECWSILKEKAFRALDYIPSEDLEQIGKEIAIKCKGIPLTAKTLGTLLQFKDSTKRAWQDVLNSDLWKLNLVQKDIFSSLLLSYHDLPPPIRWCFVYCALFPKDHLFCSLDLIDHWMAHGYLGFDNNADLESTGQEYFKILATRSFFQDVQTLEGRSMFTCKMHDIMHDFVQYLAENEFVTKEILSGNLTIESERIRHLTVILDKWTPLPSSISGAEKLRTLVAFCGEDSLTYDALRRLFNDARRLRLLALTSTSGDHLISEEIPHELGRLIHLRRLDLCHSTRLKRLPEALSNLRNLLKLDLKGCINLEKLPDGIARLINLRFLCTSGCSALTHYPKKIRRLTSLRALLGAIVRADCNDAGEFSIADLGNLKHLCRVWLNVKGETINKDEASKAKLQNVEEFKIYLAGQIGEDDITEALELPSDINLQFFDNYMYCTS